MGKPIWMWAAFMGVVLTLLMLDLGLFHRNTREISVPRELGDERVLHFNRAFVRRVGVV